MEKLLKLLVRILGVIVTGAFGTGITQFYQQKFTNQPIIDTEIICGGDKFSYAITSKSESIYCNDSECTIDLILTNLSSFNRIQENNIAGSKYNKQVYLDIKLLNENGKIISIRQNLLKDILIGETKSLRIDIGGRGDLISINGGLYQVYIGLLYEKNSIECPVDDGKELDFRMEYENSNNTILLGINASRRDDNISCDSFSKKVANQFSVGCTESINSSNFETSDTQYIPIFCDIIISKSKQIYISEQLKNTYTHISDIKLFQKIDDFIKEVYYLGDCTNNEGRNTCTKESGNINEIIKNPGKGIPFKKGIIERYKEQSIGCIFAIPYYK